MVLLEGVLRGSSEPNDTVSQISPQKEGQPRSVNDTLEADPLSFSEKVSLVEESAPRETQEDLEDASMAPNPRSQSEGESHVEGSTMEDDLNQEDEPGNEEAETITKSKKKKKKQILEDSDKESDEQPSDSVCCHLLLLHHCFNAFFAAIRFLYYSG